MPNCRAKFGCGQGQKSEFWADWRVEERWKRKVEMNVEKMEGGSGWKWRKNVEIKEKSEGNVRKDMKE